MRIFIVAALLLPLLGCSVFGDNGVESAPYTLLETDSEMAIELRNYESMILVSADMSQNGRNGAFRELFKYITGNNAGSSEIAMTAPVFMDESDVSDTGTEIAMTAPVFMSNDNRPTMSFVMPKSFSLEDTPKPNSDKVWVTEVKNYKVAAIQFSGTLRKVNVDEYTQILEKWLLENGHTAVSAPVTAGYNGPLTIPMFRKNEVLIEIQ